MSQYTLTIIIPHYNTADLLEKLLESILIKKEIQVIVVDDNSSEKIFFLNRCKQRFSEKGVEFYINTKGRGAGSCRNIGLTKALGKWIMFADADDYFLPYYYDRVKKYYETDYDLIFFAPTSSNLDTKNLGTRHVPYVRVIMQYLNHPSLANEMKLRYEYVSPWSKLYRSETIYKNKILFEDISTGNDAMFSILASFYCRKIKADAAIIYCITRSNNSLTANISEEQYDVRLEAYIRRYNFLQQHLSKIEFKKLNTSAQEKILRALVSRFSFRKIWEIIMLLNKSNVRIITWNTLNPFYLLPLIVEGLKSINSDRKYFHK